MNKSEMAMLTLRLPHDQARDLRVKLVASEISCQSLLQAAAELFINGDKTITERSRLVEKEAAEMRGAG
jgi:hypothetical protein